MDLRSKYHFGEHTRYSFGWENPNHAAAVLVCLLPLLWIAYRHAKAKEAPGNFSLLLSSEILVTSMAVLTYSRGAVLAWFAALFFHHFGPFLARRSARPHQLPAFALRSGLFIAALFATGVTQRMATATSGDGSTLNRLELWRGGMQLIAVSPWRGWGAGKSGLMFMQWVQDPMANTHYTGMVNSYVQVAVEFGLGGLLVLCAILFWPIAVYFRWRPAQESHASLLLGCTSGLVAFTVASFFTSLCLFPAVVWAPTLLLSIVMILLLVERAVRWKELAVSVGVAANVAVAFYGAARFCGANRSWSLARLAGDGVVFTARGADASPPTLYFFPDGRTLGSYYGKEIRAAVESIPGMRRFAVFPVGTTPATLPPADRIVFGSRVNDFTETGLAGTIVILPGAPPIVSEKIPTAVLLPEFDQIGFGQRWRERYATSGCRITVAPLVGQSLRGRLGEYLAKLALTSRPSS